MEHKKNIKPSSGQRGAAPKNISMVLNTIFDFFKSKIKRDLETIAKMCSSKLDNLILEEEKSKDYIYGSGEFIFEYLDKDLFVMKINLYFRNSKNEWILEEAISPPRDINYLTPKSIGELTKNKQVTFLVDHPHV